MKTAAQNLTVHTAIVASDDFKREQEHEQREKEKQHARVAEYERSTVESVAVSHSN